MNQIVSPFRFFSWARCGALLWCAFCLYGCVWPSWKMAWWLTDPALRQPGIPRLAWDVYPGLSDRFADWAEDRLRPEAQVEDSAQEIAATEWPLFSTAFYMRGMSALQDGWEAEGGAQSGRVSPAARARAALAAAAGLARDARQALWVRKMWGDEFYLTKQNIFYRFLVVTILTEHARLTGDRTHRGFLQDQVESLAAELSAAPHGWLPDYPGECYPADVAATIAAIRRADRVLGTDHAPFVRQMERAFAPERLDPNLQLPGFTGDWVSGRSNAATGCTTAWFLLNGPDVWRPEVTTAWYSRWQERFWSRSAWIAGWRESPNGSAREEPWFGGNIDAGPVIGGLGTSASVFGMGASRAYGRFDHAWPLAAQTVGVCFPLAGFGLPLPRMASHGVHAPLTGEASLLFSLTRQPAEGHAVVAAGAAGGMTIFAWLVPALVWSLAWVCCRRAWRGMRRAWR